MFPVSIYFLTLSFKVNIDACVMQLKQLVVFFDAPWTQRYKQNI